MVCVDEINLKIVRIVTDETADSELPAELNLMTRSRVLGQTAKDVRLKRVTSCTKNTVRCKF